MVAAIEEGISKGWVREEDVSVEKLIGFLSKNGKKFYKISEKEGSSQKIVIERKGETISPNVHSTDRKVVIVPFMSGEETLSLRWT